MSPRIPENFSSWLLGWSPFTVMRVTRNPPRDPNDDDDEAEEDDDEVDDDEPAVVREPDEDE